MFVFVFAFAFEFVFLFVFAFVFQGVELVQDQGAGIVMSTQSLVLQKVISQTFDLDNFDLAS